MATNKYGIVQKKWLTAFVLSLFLGVLGADRFYLGKAGTAVLKLLTLGGFGIWALIDFILIATKSMPGVEWVQDSKDDKRKAWILFGVAVLLGFILMVSASGTETTNPSIETNLNSSTQPSEPAEADTTDEQDDFAFDDGTHEVGTDIKPGTYRTKGEDGSSFGCYWARLKSFSGELDDILANNSDYGNGSQIVTIKKSDKGFETQGCGKWYAELTQVTDSKNKFSDGMFLVGTDINPGTYKSSGAEDEYSCYWARLSGFTGGLGDIIANNATGNTRVTISASNKGFSSSGCGTWTKQ